MAGRHGDGGSCEALLSRAARSGLWLVPLILSACAAGQGLQPARVDVAVADDGVQLSEAGHPILFYRSRPAEGREPWRTHYIHPVWSPGGAVITEDAPEDHVHHRGVFWAWRRILVDDVQVADGWVGPDLVLRIASPRAAALPDGSAEILASAIWTVPVMGVATPIIDESVRIRAFPVEGGQRRIEMAIDLRALRAGVALAGTDDEKGYGGLSLRLGHPDRIDIESAGQALRATVGPVRTGNEVSFSWHDSTPAWPERVEVTCSVAGRPWTSWILRQELSMQNCAFPGRSAVPVPTDRPLRIGTIIRIDQVLGP